MKFSFHFAHRPTDRWTTPLSIIRELERLGHECRIYTIFDEHDNYTHDGLRMLLNDARDGRYVPDVIVHMDFGLYKSPFLAKKRFPQAFWIFEAGDDPQSLPHNSVKAVQGFDLILCPDWPSLEWYKQQNMNVIWWPNWADTTLDLGKTITPTYDAVTSRSPDDKFFAAIKERLGDRFCVRRGFHAEEHIDFLKTGNIVIQHSQYKDIVLCRRVLEGMMAGRMVISDRIEKKTRIDELFEENKDIVYYEPTDYNVDEIVEKIKYYTLHIDEREAIARSGHDKVMKYHTQIQRTQTILENIKR